MSTNDLPILAPLGELFRSRKFLLALTVIIVALVTHLVPDLKAYADVLTNITLLVFGAVFAHLSAEDILTLRANLPTTVNQAASDAVQEAVNKLIPALPLATTTTVNVGAPDTSASATVSDGAAG